MDHEVQLISDGDGVAVIGTPGDVERFLASRNLPSKDLGLPRLKSVLQAGSMVAEAGAIIAAGTGRWVQLTAESAKQMDQLGLRESANGLATGVLKGQGGQIGSPAQPASWPSSR